MQIHPAPTDSDSLVPLPGQPADVPWPGPLSDGWPTGPIPDGVDAARVGALLDRAFGPDPDPGFGLSFATLIIQGGRIVAERYGPTSGPETPHLSWSMAKSITHSLVGILVADGRLDIDTPAPVPEWSSPDDPRHEITLDHLLRMVDGLEFCESYALAEDGTHGSGHTGAGGADEIPFSHCIDMLFGAGSDDHAAYAAARPPAHQPGAFFNYSSGTANIVARIVCDLVGHGESGERWMRERLFDPIGMSSASPTFDTAGNFVGSSFFRATARDYARFGLLHLRGGAWGTGVDIDSGVDVDSGPDAHQSHGGLRQIVSADWVDYGRTRRATDDNGDSYGAHWWLADDTRGTFRASGYECQRIMCVPASDLVLVRLGKTPEESCDTPAEWIGELISEFDPLRE